MPRTPEEIEALALFLATKVDEGPERVIAILTDVVSNALSDGLLTASDLTGAAVLMNAAGVLVNAAAREEDTDALRLAESWMTSIVDSRLLEGTRYESASLFNLANSQTELSDITVARSTLQASEPERELACLNARFESRERLRQARQNLRAAAIASDNGRSRSVALCNLANTLDHSGRWVEAYDAYVRALEADSENGNASGNAAILISRIIGAGWDYEGHLCCLYDKYLSHAKANRAGTVAVAGERTARRYDEMSLLGSTVPLTPSPADQDPYRSWIERHRLALVAALEGLGSSDWADRWDTIALNSVTSSTTTASPPQIFAILNVLKADYLVARRLAFEAEESLAETGGSIQPRSDPGVYVDTLDYAVYGEVSSKLVLAQRSALDVLDKTAVAVNEHLQIGDDPRKVSFRKFWFDDGKRTQLRSALTSQTSVADKVLALAELALDMTPGSLYGHAQDVRNAGTHRFVVVHSGIADVASTPTVQAIAVDAMLDTCHQALTVARAALIYLTDLLKTYEDLNGPPGENVVPLLLPDSL